MRPPLPALRRLTSRRFFSGVWLQVLTVMALIEAVFLAERFPMVFREVFDHHANPIDTLKLFLCNTSQVFDLALAIAVVMAVYWTALRMRENSELLVLFAAGIGPRTLVGLALIVAAIAQLVSLTVSGVLDPGSRFLQREILFKATFRALRSGINTGQFYRFPDKIAYAPAKKQKTLSPTDQTRELFLYEQLTPEKFRVITAERARLDGPDPSGRTVLKLGSFSSRNFSWADDAAKQDAPNDDNKTDFTKVTISAQSVTTALSIDELMRFMPRGQIAEESSIFTQLSWRGDPTSARTRKEMRLLGGRLSRGFLCLLAPLVALAGLCLTNRASQYFVLPLACMGLMALNVTSEWLVRILAPTSPVQAAALPLALTLAFAALLLAEIFHAQGKLARPQLNRA